jgi:integrase
MSLKSNLNISYVSRPLERWLKNFPRTTQNQYRMNFNRFIKAVEEAKGITIDDVALLELAKNNSMAFNELLLDIHRHLRAQSYSSKYAAVVYASMRSFARHNGVDGLGKIPKILTNEPVYTEQEPLTDDEVRRTELAALTGAHGLRNAAIIAVLRQSGQRRSVLTALKWGMVKEQVLQGGVVVVNVNGPLLDARGIDVRKVKHPYRFGWGSEATALIMEMINERIRRGEQIDDDSWLFRSYSLMQPGSKIPVHISHRERGPPVTEDIIWKIVTGCAKAAQVQKVRKTDRGEVLYRVTPKAFRPWFKSKVRQAFQSGAFNNMSLGFDMELVKHLMGQTCEYRDAYDKFSQEYVADFYRHVDKYLTVRTWPSIQPGDAWKHEVVSLDELPSYLDKGYELLKELSGMKYLVRVRR